MWPSAYKTDTDLYKHFTKLNAARSAAGNHSSSFFSTKATVQTNSANEIGISKSPMFAVLSNRGASSGSNQMSWSNTGLDANTQMLEVVSCQTVNTGSGGSLDITMKNGAPQVFVPASYNGDNAICSSTSDATTSGDKGGAMAAAGMPALAGVLVIAAGVGMTSFF
jgi:alpha-amylase